MVRFINISIFLFAWYSLGAQLNFDSSIFPARGDSLIYLRDIPTRTIDLQAGENKIWDLRHLESPLYMTCGFCDSDFYRESQQAGLVFTETGKETSLLYLRSEKGFEEIGFVLHFGPKGKKRMPVFYDKSILVDAASLSYGQRSHQKAQVDFELDRGDLPFSLQKDLPPSIKRIRITGIKTVNRHTDAWGKLYLPEESLLANRVSVQEYFRIGLYDTDSGKEVLFFDDHMVRQLLPFSKSSNYQDFFSDEFPYVTARIHINAQGKVSSVEYQTEKMPGYEGVDLASRYSDFVLFPNPTYNIAKVYVSNHTPGDYHIAIYNIIGKKLWSRAIRVEGQTIVKENFGFLPKGTYLISLLDNNGNILRTTRLIIISV